jgi:hypothetical protein
MTNMGDSASDKELTSAFEKWLRDKGEEIWPLRFKDALLKAYLKGAQEMYERLT